MIPIALLALQGLTYNLKWAKTRGEETAMRNASRVVSIFGPNKLAHEITGGNVQRLIAQLKRDSLSPATINRILAALSTMLTVAIEGGYIDTKPRITRQHEDEHRTRVLSDEEEAMMFRVLAEQAHPFARDACAVLIDTGLRRSELLKLPWTCVDFHNREIRVYKSKTKRPRTVPLTTKALTALSCYSGGKGPFERLTPDALQYAWDRARTFCGFSDDPEFVVHALRHTCASRLVQTGTPLTVVKEWLGHTSIAMTMRYAHFAPAQLNSARDALEKRT